MIFAISQVQATPGTEYMLLPKSKNLNWEQALELFNKGYIEDSNENILNFGFTDHNLWLKIDKDKLLTSDLILIENPNLDTIHYFYLNGNKLIEDELSGDHLPFARRYFNNNFFNSKIPENTDQVLIHINSTGQLLVPVFIISFTEYFKRISSYLRINTASIVFILITILSIFILYFWSGKPDYLLTYFTFILSGVLIIGNEMGFLFQYLWPQHPEYNYKYMQFLYLSAFLLLVFNDQILKFSKLPGYYRYYKQSYWLFPLSLIITLIFNYAVSVRILFYTLMLIVVICLTSSVQFYSKSREPIAVTVGLGWLLFLIFAGLYSIMLLGWVEYSIITRSALQMGFVVQLFFFNIMVAAKVAILQKEKATIVEKQKNQLELKVEERTVELLIKNQEIRQKNIALNEQKILLEKQAAALENYRNHLLEMVDQRTRQLMESNQNLQLTQGSFNFLAEAIPQLIFVTDSNGMAEYVNNRWVNYTGMDLTQTKSGGWVKALFPEDRKGAYEKWLDCVQTKQNYEAVMRVQNQQDGYRWHLVRGLPFTDMKGKVLKWFGTFTDIHQQKLMNEQLQQTNETLNRRNEDLDNFIYLASHELKTPAANIQGIVYGLTEILAEEEVKNTEYRTYLGMINTSVDVLNTVISRLEEISKVQTHVLNQTKQLQVNQLILNILDELTEIIQKAEAEIEVLIPEHATILFGEAEAKKVLHAVISNAILYAHPDRKPKIIIRYFEDDKFSILEIIDNGLGIKSDHLPKLFRMFERLHTHVDGSGLGLYLVKRILENHEGKIEVESEENKGSVFRLFFSKKIQNKYLITKTENLF